MPSFSRSLEKALHQALALAGERHQEYATLEHLLLALIDDQDAAAVMRACNVDLDLLRRSLVDYIDTELANLATGSGEDSKPTAGFQRAPTPDHSSRRPGITSRAMDRAAATTAAMTSAFIDAPFWVVHICTIF